MLKAGWVRGQSGQCFIAGFCFGPVDTIPNKNDIFRALIYGISFLKITLKMLLFSKTT